ncbi:chemotaxis protein CheA [Rhizobium sp. NFR03]|uniref:chemotaxis protein CheA n=1 Tax=Rhizobium sp. NFR03 TaxID=1566263 RepID=UPI0008CC1D08|nr:chemotaxis protein CheA [Rhizobium sp. NFR03]SES23231.1 two-component system, chemotaxis family, sensor kinase CheA [Rhizobium sp. NFR03]
MSPLLEQFLIEGRDFLEQIGQKLLSLEEDPGNEDIIGEIFRAVHTLKGNSGLFDMPSLTSVVHAAEDLLDRVRDRTMEMNPELTDALLEAMDFVNRLFEDVESRGAIRPEYSAQSADIAVRLRNLLPAREPQAVGLFEEEPSFVEPPADWSWLSRVPDAERLAAYEALAAEPSVFVVRYRPEPECFFKGEDPVLLVRTVPGILVFDITTPEPWPEATALDVYRCNLQFDLVSSASPEEVEHHFRYVRDQTAFYSIPAVALALPSGESGAKTNAPVDDAMIAPIYLEQAQERLETGDLDGLLDLTTTALDMINPALHAASALRWVKRLIEAGAGVAPIEFLIDALSRNVMPDWQSYAGPVDAPQAVAAVAITQAPIEEQASTRSIRDPESARVADDLAKTQIVMLQRPSRPVELAGRLRSVRNVIANLLGAMGETGAVASLDEATHIALDGADAAPLIAFIDGIAFGETAREHIEVPALEPPLALPEAEPREAVLEGASSSVAYSASPPAPQAPASRPAMLDPDAVDPAKRSGEAAGGDRGVRVLKVPQEKVDRLMDLIGEMVVAKNALPYLAARAEDHFGSRDLSREIKSQYAIINRIAEEMQDGIMQVRMLPVGAVFQRFPRLVRDVSRQLGKLVRLVVEGEETEADKNIVESLADPMIHILRNSLDHGLETPEVRRSRNKLEEGRLTVRASQEGDRVLIEIEDDGKGIDPDVVKRKAFEKGLIDEQRLETMTDAEAVQLVFAAGFSTADQISNLSGRGVGMDVVKSSLEKVGGQVQLTSEKGKGTRILLSLPLSMSVSNVMMVHIAGQQYGVPMENVMETVRVAGKDIHVFKEQRTAVLRGRIVPLYDANQLLARDSIPQPNEDGEYAVLVVRIGGQTVGIIVDGFAQTIDVILKPLEGPLACISGFSGSALLGDGSVLLVLNLKELL